MWDNETGNDQNDGCIRQNLHLTPHSGQSMTDSFTTLWTNDRCQLLRQHNQEGKNLTILFGGPHTSEPSFRRAAVKAGDIIYPVRVKQGVLYIIARLRVSQILALEDYIQLYPKVFSGCEISQWPSITFENYLKLHPEMRFLAPTCTDEVVLGSEGTPIRLDRSVPPDVVEALRFRSQRRERGIKHIQDGRIKKVISLQGIYRLSDRSAGEFARLLHI